MKNVAQTPNGDELALILLQSIKQRKQEQTFLFRLSHLFQKLVVTLIKAPEPRIGRVKDHLGNTIWCVYDPITGQSARLSSEVEVNLWLKQRYYQVNEKVS